MSRLTIVLTVCVVSGSLVYGFGPNFGQWGSGSDFRPWGGGDFRPWDNPMDDPRPRGLPYNGLRVKYGPSSSGADTEYFFSFPRTVTEAALSGLRLTKRPPGPHPIFTMYCPPGRAVCPLYDHTGLVAGLQIALPVDEYKIRQPGKNFVLWQAPAAGDEPARDYWTLTQYYIAEGSFNPLMGFPSEVDTLREQGVWVQDPAGMMMKIPTSEVELNTTTAFVKQQCVPNMGTHYYWKMSRNLQCEDLFPWFALVNRGQLIGVGLIMFGQLAPQNPRHYFEIPPQQRADSPIIPDAPQCLADWQEKYGVTTMHIYYVDDPWTITCNGDSTAESVKASNGPKRVPAAEAVSP